MKNRVCPDSIGAGSLRASFFLARKKVGVMVERFSSTPLDDVDVNIGGLITSMGERAPNHSR